MRMNPRPLQCLQTAFLLVCGLSGCSGEARYVPPEALNPAASSFSQDIASFAQSVQQDHLATYRREVRRDMFVGTVRDFAETEEWDEATLNAALKAQTAQIFLCKAQYGYQRIALRVGFEQTIGVALGSRVQASSSDVEKLVEALTTTYSIKSDAKVSPPTYDAWLNSTDGKHCVDSTQSADPFITRNYVGTEIGVAAIPAAITALESIWSLIQPVIVSTLQTVNLERRNAAIRAYFVDPNNIKLLKDNLLATESYLEKEFALAQQRSAGRAVVAAEILFSPTAEHWTKIKSIVGTSQCRAALKELSLHKTALEGVSCVQGALDAASAVLEQALNASDAFDVAQEQQLPSERLSAQIDTLQQIANGKQPTEAALKALWAAAVRYATLFKTAESVTSAANQKKIEDGGNALVKALGR